jgi:hypothetical protein
VVVIQREHLNVLLQGILETRSRFHRFPLAQRLLIVAVKFLNFYVLQQQNLKTVLFDTLPERFYYPQKHRRCHKAKML